MMNKLAKAKHARQEIEKKRIRACKQRKASQDETPKQVPPLCRNAELGVTDHALIRYMERAMDQDMESVRQSILTKKLKLLVKNLGPTGNYRVDGFVYVIVDNNIVTVTPEINGDNE